MTHTTIEPQRRDQLLTEGGNESVRNAPERLTDKQWEQSVLNLHAAKERYADLDIGALAEQGANEYLKAREALRYEHGAEKSSTLATSMAEAQTAAMVARFQSSLTPAGRLRALATYCAGMLLPIVLGSAVIAVSRYTIGLISLSTITLIGGYAVVLLIVASLTLSYVRRGALVRLLSGPTTASLAAGVAVLAFALPVVVKDVREFERMKLSTTTADVRAALVDTLTYREAGLGSKAFTLDRAKYSLLANGSGPQSQRYKIDSSGLPGSVVAELDPDGGRVYWETLGRKDVLKARVAIGELTALIERIIDSAKSAAVVANCGKQAVLVPGAMCR